jgi:transcriptional regulator with XRE-family HTH domain
MAIHQWPMQKSLNSAQHQILLGLLKQARTDQSITQEMLCERIGLSQSDISKVERGVRRLDVLELRLWLHGLGIPLVAFAKDLDARLSASELLTSQVAGRRKSQPVR